MGNLKSDGTSEFYIPQTAMVCIAAVACTALISGLIVLLTFRIFRTDVCERGHQGQRYDYKDVLGLFIHFRSFSSKLVTQNLGT